MLEVKKIKKSYGTNVIFDNISFNVDNGEVVSIVGNSGCGKSTLLKTLNRLEEIEDGTIIYNGKNINDYSLTDLRQNIGIVFQDYNLFDNLNVLENLTIGLIKIKGLSKDKSKKRALSMLKKIKLEDKIDYYPDELSGGQKQRVAIARTLLMNPKLILLDEPTAALDKHMKQEVLDLIKEISKKKVSLIIVSHEEEFVKKISDRIIYMKNDKIVIRKNKK